MDKDKTKTPTKTRTVTSNSVFPKEIITEAEMKQESQARVSRIDRELDKGFEIVDRYTNTVTIFGSARFEEGNEHYDKAREVSAALANEGYTVVTGGGGGIMEAGNRGAYEAEGQSLGFNITLPHEQHLNPYTTESMPFRYFFTRKVILSYGATGYVYFPGGFGTLDEFFEILTLIQTRKMPMAPLVLVGKEYWTGLDKYIKEHMLKGDKTISVGDELLYTITDDTDEILQIINTYRDHHYVRTI